MDEETQLAQNDAITIHAGFPNPAADQLSGRNRLALDLNQLLIHHPSSTYAFHIRGHEWEALGIFDGDVALIDRALQPQTQTLVIAWQSSGFIVCRYSHLRRSDQYWGVVSTVIHQFGKGTGE